MLYTMYIETHEHTITGTYTDKSRHSQSAYFRMPSDQNKTKKPNKQQKQITNN